MKTVATLLGLLACGLISAAMADEKAKLVEPTSVKKVVADGKHNAFTGMVRWKDQYWLAFRKAESHNSGDGDIVVLRSSDGEEWSEALTLNVLPDDRDPQFLTTEDRLFLYDPSLQGGELTSYVTYTDDGQTWSEPQPVYKPRYIFWKPTKHAGKFYATAHLKSRDGKERDVYLITSTDGLEWETVSKIRGGNWESETTIHFDEDGRAIAFLRQKYGSPQSSILESKPPYEEWTARDAGYHLSGHAIYTFDGVDYLFSRTRDGKEMGTMIYTYQGDKLIPYCRLPAGGDCSYPAAVQVGDEMLVSYYSSHEGATNIYLARVPLMGK